MRVVIGATPEAVYEASAARLAQVVRDKPSCVLGLATGRTMVPLYAEVVRLHRQGTLSLRDVVTFNLDEYIGIAPGAPHSFREFMNRQLVERTDLRPEAVHLPDGLAESLFAEAERYEGAIHEAGGIDLQVLGLGRNGHVGFNEPGSSLQSRTRIKALTEETVLANREDLLDLGPARPAAAITMGLGTILASRACVLLAVGSAKAAAVAAMVEGPVTARVPASALQMHPEVTVFVDRSAAEELTNREYYLRAERLQRELESREGGVTPRGS